MLIKGRDNAIRGEEQDGFKMDEKRVELTKLVTGKRARRNMNIKEYVKMLKRMCEELLEKRRKERKRRQVYWWNDEISEKKKECLRRERRIVKGNKRDRRKSRERYKKARKEMKKPSRC